MPDTARQPVRADARRNRERLLTAAREAFASGTATISMQELAAAAGIGVGTLYRHFPTREALVDAVYSAELDELTECASELLHSGRADLGLRTWMDRYAAFVETKRGMLDTLRSGWAAGTIATPDTRARIAAVIGAFLAAGAEQGTLRDDVPAEDIAVALAGMMLSGAAIGSAEQTGRLLDLLVDGLRPRT